MRKKCPVPFAEKFPNLDPLAICLLQRLLAFDPNDRPTAEQALADPYFKGLAKVEREPSSQPISKLEFAFETRTMTREDIRAYREILEYHPQRLKDHLAKQSTNFLYPSAIGQFRTQFAYLVENGGESGPVIPLARKHVSLPQSTVNSSTIPPKPQHSLAAFDRLRITEACNSSRVIDTISGNLPKASRPPPCMPTAIPGRVAGPVLPYESSRCVMGTYDTRAYVQNAVLPQSLSPHYVFRTSTGNQENHARKGKIDSSVIKQLPPQSMPKKASLVMPMNLNTNPYVQQQGLAGQFNDQMAIDSKLLQAQSQFGAVGAAVAVSVAASRG